MNSLWILLACGVACAFAQPTCDQVAIERCERMGPFSDGGDMFPSEPSVLREKCRQAMPAFECYNDLVRKCPHLVSREKQQWVFGSKNLLDRMCEAGDYQQQYLRNAQCFNDIINTKQDICEARAAREATPGLCEYFRSIESCLKSFVRNTCDEDAPGIFRDIFNVLSFNFLNGSCD